MEANVSLFAAKICVAGSKKVSLNLLRNILLPQQMCPRLHAEETFRETTEIRYKHSRHNSNNNTTS